MHRLADVSRVTDDAGVSVQITYRSRLCEECGYELHGLDPGRACPECGHVGAPAVRELPRPADLAWRRSVAVGLVLMLWVVLDAVSGVLVQPFSGDPGGSLAALNLPAPKVWAVPLLQRPIGRAPELPGVRATRTALLGLFALWLITAPRPAPAGQRPPPLRAFTRWTGVVLFGLAFGLLVTSRGLGRDELRPYRLMLVGGVELPATALLYCYLRRLADTVPGQARRRTFGHLQWLVPLVVLGAALMIGYRWLEPEQTGWAGRDATELTLAALGYGCVVVPCAAVATAAVASLAASFWALAFPDAWRVVSGGRRMLASAWRAAAGAGAAGAGADADAARWRAAGIAVGLALLAFLAVVGNDRILWYSTRMGLGGNLPYFNYPGPKVWTAAVAEPGYSYYYSYTWVSRATLLALNLAAVWLVTLRPRAPGRSSLLRPLARWSAVGSVGAAMGVAAGWSAAADTINTSARGELFATLTMTFELPATMLLYAYLAQLSAREAKRPRLRAAWAVLCVALPVMVVCSLSAFGLSGRVPGAASSLLILAACGAYGTAMFTVAVCACVMLLSLAAALVRERLPRGAAVVDETSGEGTRAPAGVRSTAGTAGATPAPCPGA